MADNADRAADYQELMESDANNAARACVGRGESLSECEHCGSDIPVERQAFGGVTMCVDCASEFERMEAMRRGS